MNKKIKKILSKKSKTPIISLTAYSYNIAKIIDKFCDITLVGDSLANVLYGMKSTHNLSLDVMIRHGISVKPAVKKSLLVIDMPKGTYDNFKSAVINAKKIIKKTKCDAVKIESNFKNFKIIEKLTKSNIQVMGHIGFTPQFKKKFKVHGKSNLEAKKLLKDAKKIEEAGAFSIVLECIYSPTAKKITESINIPTIGIGSSVYCDGQILVTDDILGISGFYPKFVKKFANLSKLIEKAVHRYSQEVKKSIFPGKSNSY